MEQNRFRILGFWFPILGFGFWILGFGFWVSDLGFSDFGFWVSDFGFRGFSFQIPNAIDKLKIGALQRANFKLVNCLNDWLLVFINFGGNFNQFWGQF